MGGGKIEIEITLGVSDETAAACCVVLNHYLRSHPEMDVRIVRNFEGDDHYREVRLKQVEQ